MQKGGETCYFQFWLWNSLHELLHVLPASERLSRGCLKNLDAQRRECRKHALATCRSC